jgi:hypothetical protein
MALIDGGALFDLQSCHAFMTDDEWATHMGVACWLRTAGIPGAT